MITSLLIVALSLALCAMGMRAAYLLGWSRAIEHTRRAQRMLEPEHRRQSDSFTVRCSLNPRRS